MTVQKLHKSFITSHLSYILAIVIVIVFRLLYYDDLTNLQMWLATMIQIAVALSFFLFNKIYNLIRERTTLPTFFYVLLIGTNPLYFNNLTGGISALIVMLCWFFLLGTYQNPNSQRRAFNLALCLSLGAFYWPLLLALFPVFWYGMFQMRSLNLKTLFANLLGIILVGLFMLTWAYYHEDWSLFTYPVQIFQNLFFELWIISDYYAAIRFLLLFILIILAGIQINIIKISEKIHTVIISGYLFLFALFLTPCYCIMSQWKAEWGLIFNLPTAFLLAHFFSNARQKWKSWLFFIIILLLLLFFVLQFLTDFRIIPN